MTFRIECHSNIDSFIPLSAPACVVKMIVLSVHTNPIPETSTKIKHHIKSISTVAVSIVASGLNSWTNKPSTQKNVWVEFGRDESKPDLEIGFVKAFFRSEASSKWKWNFNCQHQIRMKSHLKAQWAHLASDKRSEPWWHRKNDNHQNVLCLSI